MGARLGRAHDAVTQAGFFLAKLCLVSIVGSYTFETVARYAFASPTSWSNEVVGYALCIGTFLAMPELTRRNGHIAITFVLETLPPRPRRWLGAAIAVVAGLVCLAIAGISFQENVRQVVKEVVVVAMNPFPKVWISAWITYGFLSSGLHFLRLAARPVGGAGIADVAAARA